MVYDFAEHYTHPHQVRRDAELRQLRCRCSKYNLLRDFGDVFVILNEQLVGVKTPILRLNGRSVAFPLLSL